MVKAITQAVELEINTWFLIVISNPVDKDTVMVISSANTKETHIYLPVLLWDWAVDGYAKKNLRFRIGKRCVKWLMCWVRKVYLQVLHNSPSCRLPTFPSMKKELYFCMEKVPSYNLVGRTVPAHCTKVKYEMPVLEQQTSPHSCCWAFGSVCFLAFQEHFGSSELSLVFIF